MVNEKILKASFQKAKDDVEGVKNELAFALRRIAKIEELLIKQAVSGNQEYKKNSKKKK